MQQAEFDRFADEYDDQHRQVLAVTGEGPEYFHEYKLKVLSEIANSLGIGARTVLDFGSGVGNSIPYFRRYLPGARLLCADVSRRSLDLAEARYPGSAESLLIEGNRLPADDGGFDVVFSACVFHHIPHEEHVHWLAELRRITRPGGMLAIFEHNPLNPLTVRAVRNCAFDANAHLIRAGRMIDRFTAAGWREPCARYHLFFPHALSALRPLERNLSGVPFGAQYSVTARKEP